MGSRLRDEFSFPVRAQAEHLVDRPQLQAGRPVEASGTNSPSSSLLRIGGSPVRAIVEGYRYARHAAARVALGLKIEERPS